MPRKFSRAWLAVPRPASGSSVISDAFIVQPWAGWAQVVYSTPVMATLRSASRSIRSAWPRAPRSYTVNSACSKWAVDWSMSTDACSAPMAYSLFANSAPPSVRASPVLRSYSTAGARMRLS